MVGSRQVGLVLAAPGLGPAPPPGSAGSGGPTPRAGGGQAALGAPPDTGHQNFLIRTLLVQTMALGRGVMRGRLATQGGRLLLGPPIIDPGGRLGGVGGRRALTCRESGWADRSLLQQPAFVRRRHAPSRVLPTAALIKPGVVEWRRWWWERANQLSARPRGPGAGG